MQIAGFVLGIIGLSNRKLPWCKISVEWCNSECSVLGISRAASFIKL
jgi:hypothetical protein